MAATLVPAQDPCESWIPTSSTCSAQCDGGLSISDVEADEVDSEKRFSISVGIDCPLLLCEVVSCGLGRLLLLLLPLAILDCDLPLLTGTDECDFMEG